MKTITEYLINNHIKKTPSLFIKDMNFYKVIDYKDFMNYSEGWQTNKIAVDVVDIVKKLYHVSKLTKDIIIDFFEVHYTEFIKMQFDDKRINKKIEEKFKKSNFSNFSSTSATINYFKENLNKREGNNEENFTYWGSPCLFNAFIKLVDEINNETV